MAEEQQTDVTDDKPLDLTAELKRPRRGRPSNIDDIDEHMVYELAKIHCTYAEMSAFFRIDAKTLRKHFSPVIKEGKEQGKMSLRHAQFKSAQNGSVPMLIWLGKQLLEQKDRIEFDAGDTHFIMTLKGPGQAIDEAQGGNGEVKQIEGEVVPDGDGTEDGHDNE